MLIGTYSLLDVSVSINGPGGVFLMGGPDTAAADEHVTLALTEETNTQNVGGDGSVMNSLHASRAGTITVRLQKISPVNAQLSQLYGFQRQSSGTWGLNVITVRNAVTGDIYTCTGCAFERHANNSYAKLGNILEWMWHVAKMDPSLGTGILLAA